MFQVRSLLYLVVLEYPDKRVFSGLCIAHFAIMTILKLSIPEIREIASVVGESA